MSTPDVNSTPVKEQGSMVSMPLSTFKQILRTLDFSADNADNQVVTIELRRVREELKQMYGELKLE